MKRTALALATIVGLTMAGLSAQSATSFAGKWTLEGGAMAPGGGAARGPGGPGGGMAPGAGMAPGGGMGGRGMGGGNQFCGQECTVTQDATSLTVTRTTPAGDTKSVYKLDGSDSKNSMAMGQMQMESVSKAVWDGGKLVITTTQDMMGNTVQSKTTLSLEGGKLVVERSAPGRQGGEPTVTKQTYSKS